MKAVLSVEGNSPAMPVQENVSAPALNQRATGSLKCEYREEPIEQILDRDDLLLAIRYNEPCLPTTNPRLYHCGLNNLSSSHQTEVWTSASPITSGTDGQCHWSQTDECLIASLVVDEDTFTDQSTAIESAYTKLLTLLKNKGFPHIIRAWNYMANINQGAGDNERYRLFCVGRQRSFSEHQYDQDQYPSACALGHSDGHTIVYLLATKTPGQHFENPNQQSAYQYPRQYGPKSPSFARATLVNWRDKSQLYISGTASIIGHASILGDENNHSDNLAVQLMTTLSNIDQLLAHVADQAALPAPPQPSSLKVYIRHSADYQTIKAAVEEHYGAEIDVFYAQAEICREELLLEIDGLCEI